MPMNFAMLSTDSSSPMQPLTLCSEDDDELSNIPLGSNLWESIFINSNHNNEMENMVTISTNLILIFQKMQICCAYVNYLEKIVSDLLKVNVSELKMP
jgi:hypothetical protein